MRTTWFLPLFLAAFPCLDLPAATFLVTSTANSGPGTLRQAISDANVTPGQNWINFNIPGPGVQTIAPTNPLPDITNVVLINGFSQPGSRANTSSTSDNSIHLIRLDGYSCQGGSGTGLSFQPAATFGASPASGSTVRGLVIVRFSVGIKLYEAANITIAGNWVGMDVDGIARGNSTGINIDSFFRNSFYNVIGGLAPADRNIISGSDNGIWFSGHSDFSVVEGNFIGTDPTGTLPRGNGVGVFNFTSSNLLIGGTNGAPPNLICASSRGEGIFIQSGSTNIIQNNHIGTDATGQLALGNSGDGIGTWPGTTRVLGNMIVNNRGSGISLSSDCVAENNLIGTDATGTRPMGNAAAGIALSGGNNHIGGFNPGQANTIQFNGNAGVWVSSSSAAGNIISGNSIYDNGGLGIDLSPSGINTNSPLNMTNGANALQNYPVLSKAVNSYGTLTLQGTLNSSASSAFRLEFFSTPPWDGAGIPEGRLFLGSASVTTDVNGLAGFTTVFPLTPDPSTVVTATATDPNGNTSEFSAGISITTNSIPALVMTPNAAGADGSITNFTVSWPSAAASYSLEKTPSLAPPVVWTPVTSGILDDGQTRTLIVSPAITNTSLFFRLKGP